MTSVAFRKPSRVLRQLAQLEFLDLTGARLRQFGEHDVARAFEAREVLPAPGDELVGARLAPGLELNEGARCLAPFRVRFRHHGGGRHRRMLVERVLDLDRGDVLPPEMMMSLERSLIWT